MVSLLAYDNTQDSFIEKPAIELAVKQLAVEPRQSTGHPHQPTRSGRDAANLSLRRTGCDSSRTRSLAITKSPAKSGPAAWGRSFWRRILKLQRQVAIKLLQSPQQFTPQFVQRFYREARTASALNHPNIVTIYSIDEIGGAEPHQHGVYRGRNAQGPPGLWPDKDSPRSWRSAGRLRRR